jgi:hypothetical protein
METNDPWDKISDDVRRSLTIEKMSEKFEVIQVHKNLDNILRIKTKNYVYEITNILPQPRPAQNLLIGWLKPDQKTGIIYLNHFLIMVEKDKWR